MNWNLSAIRPKELWQLGKEEQACSNWSHDRAPRLGAAGLLHGLFHRSASHHYHRDDRFSVWERGYQGVIIQQIAGLVEKQSAAAIKDMIQRADMSAIDWLISTAIAIVTLLLVHWIFRRIARCAQ